MLTLPMRKPLSSLPRSLLILESGQRDGLLAGILSLGSGQKPGQLGTARGRQSLGMTREQGARLGAEGAADLGWHLGLGLWGGRSQPLYVLATWCFLTNPNEYATVYKSASENARPSCLPLEGPSGGPPGLWERLGVGGVPCPCTVS